jgi:uncharacterized protein YjbJ (UPF0337 family)
MNKDLLAGKWKQLRGEIKTTWGKLTNDEIDRIEGDFDKLVGTLQEKYGYTKMEARDEVNDFLDHMRDEDEVPDRA